MLEFLCFRWRKEDCENLYWYFALNYSGPDLIENIVRLSEENGVSKITVSLIKSIIISNTNYFTGY